MNSQRTVKRISFLAIFLVFAPLVALAADCYTHNYFGIPHLTDQLLCRSGFAVGYRYDTKTPGWVAYRLTAASVSFRHERSNNFDIDLELPMEARATLEDYRGSGYDRGHLAPAASIDFSEIALEESFLLSAIVPQDPQFNRGGWQELEAYVRALAISRKDIWVVAGPVFQAKYLKIGVSGVGVPNAFFKVIFDPVNQQMLAFLVPHKEFTREDIASFIVSVDAVEKLTGYDFFNLLEDSYEDALESYVSPLWR